METPMRQRLLNHSRGMVLLLAGALALAGCQKTDTTPMPGVLPSAGMLLKSTQIPLSSRFRLDNCQVYRSPISNDWYPFNLPSAKPAEKIVSRLYRSDGPLWTFLDFAELPKAQANNCPGVSHNGRMILYMAPDVARLEGDYPHRFGNDRRTYRVFIYDSTQAHKFPLDRFCRVYSVGWASQWRSDDSAIGFTATCSEDPSGVGQLVITDPFGHVLLDGTMQPELIGLEFLAFSPDGRKVAALRPSGEQAGVSQGGELIEVDIHKATLRKAGDIPPLTASRHVDHIEWLVDWGTKNHLAVRPTERRDK
jgi:hypothetical protein